MELTSGSSYFTHWDSKSRNTLLNLLKWMRISQLVYCVSEFVPGSWAGYKSRRLLPRVNHESKLPRTFCERFACHLNSATTLPTTQLCLILKKTFSTVLKYSSCCNVFPLLKTEGNSALDVFIHSVRDETKTSSARTNFILFCAHLKQIQISQWEAIQICLITSLLLSYVS